MAAAETRIGVMFRRDNPPSALPEFARRAEALGFQELWVVEDCFYASGIASAAIALAVTSTMRIGLGIMPAVARNPAFTAMEIATLAGTYPGRFIAGIGHGVAAWMKQIGAFPKSQLAALGETAESVRQILRGESVTYHGDHVHLESIKLEFPPQHVPPVLLGVRGPRSLAVAGRTADGALLAELASPAYVRWAAEQITAGQAEAGRSAEPCTIAAYALCAVDSSADAARQRLRPLIAAWIRDGQADYLRPLGIEAEVKAMLDAGTLASDMPAAWIDQLAVVGTPSDCAASIRRLNEAGAAQVILVPEAPGIASLESAASILSV